MKTTMLACAGALAIAGMTLPIANASPPGSSGGSSGIGISGVIHLAQAAESGQPDRGGNGGGAAGIPGGAGGLTGGPPPAAQVSPPPPPPIQKADPAFVAACTDALQNGPRNDQDAGYLLDCAGYLLYAYRMLMPHPATAEHSGRAPNGASIAGGRGGRGGKHGKGPHGGRGGAGGAGVSGSGGEGGSGGTGVVGAGGGGGGGGAGYYGGTGGAGGAGGAAR